jgi:N-sulfoglucosamine sulfohydrolase
MNKVTRRSFATLPAATAIAQSPGSQPNIVFLISDDHSAPDLGCYGNKAIGTPNLDALARDGIRFQTCVVTSPQCSPNRSAMFTGCMAHTTSTSRLHAPMPPWEQTFLEGLRARGYYTGAFRKVHQGPAFEKSRLDFYAGPKAPFSEFFANRPKNRPFFLQVGFTDPHRPYKKGAFKPPHDPAKVRLPAFLPDDADVRNDLADYYDEIARMDGECGAVFELLRSEGLWNNTVVVFTGDNGMPFPRAKGTCYDAGLVVPLIVRMPGAGGRGAVRSELMSHIDLAPTFLDFAGAPVPSKMQGRSFKPLLDGTAYAPRREAFSSRNWHDNFDPSRSIRTSAHKLIYNTAPATPYRPIRDLAESPTWTAYNRLFRSGQLSPQHLRLMEPSRPVFELYDLAADPDEFNNVATVPEKREVFADLRRRLSDWMHDTYDFLPPPLRVKGQKDNQISII